MRNLRRYFVVCLLVASVLILGCGKEEAKPMKGQVPGEGPSQKMEMKIKAGNKPLPDDPPAPKAPKQ
jgi:hypothetical protein